MKNMKQAVVVIHGMGEQKQSETGESFTESVLPLMTSGKRAEIRSQPDQSPEFPNLLNHRRWSWSPADVSSYEPDVFGKPWIKGIHVDFYEYYWAYLLQDNKYENLLSWILSLSYESGKNVPPRLKNLWRGCRGVILISVFFVILAFYKIYTDEKFAAGSSFVSAIVSFFFIPILGRFILGYLGDAARYLHDPKGNYIPQGQIKSNGKKFLKRLHESGEYDRIILVGHSLGSVIGYDIINDLWREYKREWERKVTAHEIQNVFDEKALEDVERVGTALGPSSDCRQVEEFQKKQHVLWLKQCTNDHAWLISDFITLGSPLTYYPYLTGASEEFQKKKDSRELATCPPTESKEAGDRPYSYKSDDAWLLHHAAPFACSRWTNIYFEGDIVGGPLKLIFGPGIGDKGITAKDYSNLAKDWRTHTWYWLGKKQSPAEKDLKDSAIIKLRKALKLNLGADSLFEQ